MPRINLDEVARRPRQYWNVDGAPDLIMGLVFMAWGGIAVLGREVGSSLFSAVSWVLLMLTAFAAMPLVKRLKARVSFPRTGYVEWNPPSRGQRFATGIIAAVAGVALALMIGRGVATDHIVLGFCLVLSVGCVVGSVIQRAPHMLVLAVVALLLGVAFDAWKADWRSLSWVLVAFGMAQALLGAVRLAQFVRSHPRSSPGLS
jgi:hypothetical protein